MLAEKIMSTYELKVLMLVFVNMTIVTIVIYTIVLSENPLD